MSTTVIRDHINVCWTEVLHVQYCLAQLDFHRTICSTTSHFNIFTKDFINQSSPCTALIATRYLEQWKQALLNPSLSFTANVEIIRDSGMKLRKDS